MNFTIRHQQGAALAKADDFGFDVLLIASTLDEAYFADAASRALRLDKHADNLHIPAINPAGVRPFDRLPVSQQVQDSIG